MKKNFKFSIITCCKNSMPYIIENIKSIEKQSFKNYEHLFILSKSNYQTDKYLKIKKKRVLNFNSSNIYKCINYGIKKSKGEIIYLLHSDDEVISKNLLKKINDTFKDDKVEFIYGDCNIVKRFNKNLTIRKWKSKLILKKNILKQKCLHIQHFLLEKKFFLNFYITLNLIYLLTLIF